MVDLYWADRNKADKYGVENGYSPLVKSNNEMETMDVSECPWLAPSHR